MKNTTVSPRDFTVRSPFFSFLSVHFPLLLRFLSSHATRPQRTKRRPRGNQKSESSTRHHLAQLSLCAVLCGVVVTFVYAVLSFQYPNSLKAVLLDWRVQSYELTQVGTWRRHVQLNYMYKKIVLNGKGRKKKGIFRLTETFNVSCFS